MKAAFSKLLFRLRSNRRAFLCAAAFSVILIVCGIFLIQALMDPYDCRIVSNVSVSGLDVGGMTRREARKALKAAAEETLYSMDLTVELPEETISLSPENTRVKLSIRKAVNAAYQIGRTGTKEEQQAALETSHDISLSPFLTCDGDYILRVLEDYASRYDTSLAELHYEMSGVMPDLDVASFDPEAPCQTLELTLGTPEAHLDTQAVYAQILAVYDRAIAAARAGEYGIRADVIPEALPLAPDLDALYEKFTVVPVDDSLDMQTYAEVPGSYGYSFDLEAANAAVAEAQWGETVSIPMTYVEPEILGAEVYFRDVLGSCETRHTDDENRNTNLRLVCEILNGLVLQPGEEFSYNGAVGERTEARGFKSAGAYSGNRLVKDIGGGVCQGSTTLYNCVLLADLEVLERVCHGFTVTYVPIGLDAAVNWATSTDFKFRNNTHFPIMIQAEVSDGYMRMQILGTDEKDYYIEMKSGYSEEELRIYANSYKYKYDKETGELISRELEARSSYMYYSG